MNKATTLLCTAALAAIAVGASGCSKKRSKNLSSTVATSTSSTTTNTGSGSGTAATTSGGSAATTSGAAPASPSPTGAQTATNPGSATFIDGSAALPNSSTDDFGVAIADLDGDKDQDLFIAAHGAPSRILTNDQGTFTLALGSFPNIVMRATDAKAVDIDKDGDIDLVVSSNAEPLRVFENDGGGTFTLAATYALNNEAFTYKLAVGDMNGDGYADVFLANAGQNTASRGQNRLFLNDGAGALSEAPAGSVPSLFDDSIAALMLDFDNDGDLDVFVANFGTAHRLLVNDGAGRLSDGSDTFLPPLVSYGTSAVGADFNQDGYQDVFLGNEGAPANAAPPSGERNSLLLGSASGFTNASATLPDHADATFGLTLLDANGDGWIDVAAATLRGTQKLYLNLQGSFVDATPNLPAANSAPSSSLAVASEDVDGDLTPDLIFLQRNAKPFLFLNVPRARNAPAAKTQGPL